MAQNIDIHQQLIILCKNGDQRAQYQLYHLYAKQMLNISLRIVNNQMEAEDVLQESFINAFTKIKNFRGDSSFGSWLKRIVINTSLNVVKKKKEFYEDLKEDHVANEPDENDEREASYTIKDIQEAMSQLADGYRVIFSMYMFEDMSHNEIAKELNISVNTSKSQLSRARSKMKELMIKNQNHEEG